jgi:hypothetical protein
LKSISSHQARLTICTMYWACIEVKCNSGKKHRSPLYMMLRHFWVVLRSAIPLSPRPNNYGVVRDRKRSNFSRFPAKTKRSNSVQISRDNHVRSILLEYVSSHNRGCYDKFSPCRLHGTRIGEEHSVHHLSTRMSAKLGLV